MSAPSSTSRRTTGPRSKREREEEQDQRLITLHLLLQALSGQTITVELCSGNLIAGILHQVDDEMNIQMSVATSSTHDRSTSSNSDDWVHISGSDVFFVHMPQGTDSFELLQARMRAIDQGRTQFRRRVKKKVVPKPTERLAPLVSERITEAHDT